MTIYLHILWHLCPCQLNKGRIHIRKVYQGICHNTLRHQSWTVYNEWCTHTIFSEPGLTAFYLVSFKAACNMTGRTIVCRKEYDRIVIEIA